jgi:5-methyltetrahydrofolate--homocysteine methyltransferase
MLYGRHLGVKGGVVRLLEKSVHDASARRELEEKDPKALNIWKAVQEVKDEYRGTEIMKPSAVYRYFNATSEGNRLHLFENTNLSQPSCSFDFPRQRKVEGLCLADYVLPQDGSKPRDNVAMFVVSVGKGIRQIAEQLKNRGDYLKSHIVQALALESAEAYAEMLHSQLRKAWGFPDHPEMTMMERFQAKYRGKRYSFGYPACPRLDDQALLWKMLQPNEIGVQLTDGFMMDPEASVSALVFHHPVATYFSVGHQSGDGTNEDNR